MRPIPTEPCLALIHAFEGKAGAFEAVPTQDPSGNWEIGWSHKLSGDFDRFMRWTREQADAQALVDLTAGAQGICNYLGAALSDLNANQYAACIDFAYNEGLSRFVGSTLGHLIKHGNLTLAPAEFPKWIYERDPKTGKEVQSNGLIRRRKAELDVWNG